MSYFGRLTGVLKDGRDRPLHTQTIIESVRNEEGKKKGGGEGVSYMQGWCCVIIEDYTVLNNRINIS